MSKKNNTSAKQVNDEAVVAAQLEAQDTQTTASVPAKAKANPVIDPGADILETVAQIDDKQRLAVAKKVTKAVEDRTAFEKAKNPLNNTIAGNLEKGRAKLAMPSAAAFLIATNVDPEFVNRSVANGSRYNVYAVDKLADLVQCLRDGVMRNAINNAVTRSMFAFRKAGIPFTGELAKAAASQQYPVSSKTMKDLLIRHTVAPGTASTQTSSTMTALQTLGVVSNVGTGKFPIYELVDCAATKRLEQVLIAA